MPEKFGTEQRGAQETEILAFERAGFSPEEIKDYKNLISQLDPEEADGMTLTSGDPEEESRLKEYTRRILKTGV